MLLKLCHSESPYVSARFLQRANRAEESAPAAASVFLRVLVGEASALRFEIKQEFWALAPEVGPSLDDRHVGLLNLLMLKSELEQEGFVRSFKEFLIRALSAVTGIGVVLLGWWMAYLGLYYYISALRFPYGSVPFWKSAIIVNLIGACVGMPLYAAYRFIRFAIRPN